MNYRIMVVYLVVCLMQYDIMITINLSQAFILMFVAFLLCVYVHTYICTLPCPTSSYDVYVCLFQCPLEIGSGTLNLQGEYQTMLGQGAILQQRPPSGRIYLGITIVPDDFSSNASICSTTLSADLLASFVTIERKGDDNAAGPSITSETFSRKNITLRVRPGRSGE